MTILKHELRQGRRSLLVWTGAVGLLLVVCVFLFPEMKGEMEGITEVFGSMGSFTAAFGMDRLDFGTLVGYYAIECGNVLGLGGAFFAALMGISALAKEERDRTAEFLLSHPISRRRIFGEKLGAVLCQILGMNGVIFALVAVSMTVIGEKIPWQELLLLHLAYLLLQVELAGICFGLSAFLRRGSLGVGLGLAALLYCLNLMANITEKVKFLKYITPFAYCEGADIVTEGSLDTTLVLLGMGYMAVCLIAGFWCYTRKDIQ